MLSDVMDTLSSAKRDKYAAASGRSLPYKQAGEAPSQHPVPGFL